MELLHGWGNKYATNSFLSYSLVFILGRNLTQVYTRGQGEPINTCASDPTYCPTPKDLSSITALEVWAEGVAGEFHLDIQTIGAA